MNDVFLEFSREVASQLGMVFHLYKADLSFEDVFSFTGMFPMIVKRANAKCLETLGYGIGVSFNETDGATLGYSVVFDTVTPPVLKLVYLYDTLLELKANENKDKKIVLDDLLFRSM